MRVIAFLAGGVVGMLLIGAAGVLFLFSGDKEVAPLVSPQSTGASYLTGPSVATRAPGSLVIKARVELPEALLPLAKDGILLGGISFGTRYARMPWTRIGREIRFANPKFPLEVEFELSKEDLDVILPEASGGMIRLNLYLCQDGVNGCVAESRHTLRGRRFFVMNTSGKTIKELFKGKKEIDVGTFHFSTAFKHLGRQECVDGKTTLSGKLVLTEKAHAQVRKWGGAVIGVSSLMQFGRVFSVQPLDMEKVEQDFHVQGLAKTSRYVWLGVFPCKKGEDSKRCLEKAFFESESSDLNDPPYFGVVGENGEIPFCGQANVKLFGYLELESPNNPNIPPEVRRELENFQPAL